MFNNYVIYFLFNDFKVLIMFDFYELKNKVIAGYPISKKDALNLLNIPLDELSKSADEIRKHFCSNKFDICTIINVKSGRCTEDCKFCAQSNFYNTSIDIYPLLDSEELKKQTLAIVNEGIKRVSYVASGKQLSDDEIQEIANLISQIKKEYDVNICVSLGFLNQDQLHKLKLAGVDRIHNNLEASPNYFKEICTSHNIDDKLATLKLINKEDLTICSGGIFGLNESFEDRIDLAILLRELGIKSIPVNILNPIPGTPLENNEILSTDEVCRIVAILRFILPDSFIRLAGGRALLENNGKRCFISGANATISGNMLTTNGITIKDDLAMLNDLDYEISYKI